MPPLALNKRNVLGVKPYREWVKFFNAHNKMPYENKNGAPHEWQLLYKSARTYLQFHYQQIVTNIKIDIELEAIKYALAMRHGKDAQKIGMVLSRLHQHEGQAIRVYRWTGTKWKKSRERMWYARGGFELIDENGAKHKHRQRTYEWDEIVKWNFQHMPKQEGAFNATERIAIWVR